MIIIKPTHRLVYFFLCLFFALPIVFQTLVAQEIYSSCLSPYQIEDPSKWCSENNAFNNIGVSDSGYGPATCWDNGAKDIWLKFTAVATTVNIVVKGVSSLENKSTQVGLYTGVCGGVINELKCGKSTTFEDVVNIVQAGLIVGKTYFIRINKSEQAEGNFTVCVDNYNPPVEPGQDCNTAAILCDKSPFVVQSVTGAGDILNEAQGTCLGNSGVGSEQQSTWFRWTAANNGTLTFTITPLNPTDDIDFVLYEIIGTGFSCSAKNVLRCMATACEGPTGLNETSTDLEEDLNCDPGEDGFVKYIDMEKDKTYLLMINNFTNSMIGFSMEFGGTGEFKGPEPNFTVSPTSLECDQTAIVTDITDNNSDIGNIVKYNWYFGEGAIPESANTKGPHEITYSSFGQKYIVLEVTTDRGCIVSKIIPVYAGKCCKDFDEPTIKLEGVKDVLCCDEKTGEITVSGEGSKTPLIYSIGELINGSGNFIKLAEGTYTVKVTDIKGCVDSLVAEVACPNKFSVNAGEDQSINLGYKVNFNASVEPPNKNGTITWFPDSLMSCKDCFDPSVLPLGNTTYVISFTDENGCVVTDSVNVVVRDERPVYVPNTFSPNNDGKNEIFTVFAGPAAKSIETLSIFDRWGNLMYKGSNLEISKPNIGWNGQFNGRYVDPGVYAWVANIRFIDDKIIPFNGSVTVIR